MGVPRVIRFAQAGNLMSNRFSREAKKTSRMIAENRWMRHGGVAFRRHFLRESSGGHQRNLFAFPGTDSVALASKQTDAIAASIPITNAPGGRHLQDGERPFRVEAMLFVCETTMAHFLGKTNRCGPSGNLTSRFFSENGASVAVKLNYLCVSR